MGSTWPGSCAGCWAGGPMGRAANAVGGHDPGRTAGELPGIAGGHGPAPGYSPWDDPSAERHGLSNLGHALRHLPTWDRFRTRPRSGRARLVVLLWCTGDVPLLGDEFDWDEANCNHVREAGVEPEEAEEALLDPQWISRDVYNLHGEHRRGAIGATENGRLLFVVFTMRRGRVRVITARGATLAEKRRYRRRGK